MSTNGTIKVTLQKKISIFDKTENHHLQKIPLFDYTDNSAAKQRDAINEKQGLSAKDPIFCDIDYRQWKTKVAGIELCLYKGETESLTTWQVQDQRKHQNHIPPIWSTLI